MASPFETYRNMVLWHYSTAAWLRTVILSMWNGTEHTVSMTNLTNMDAEHTKACIAMITSYAANGESDPAFVALTVDVRKRHEEEIAATERNNQFESWLRNLRPELRKVGESAELTEDKYNWCEAQFDADMTPAEAAAAAAALKLSDATYKASDE